MQDRFESRSKVEKQKFKTELETDRFLDTVHSVVSRGAGGGDGARDGVSTTSRESYTKQWERYRCECESRNEVSICENS